MDNNYYWHSVKVTRYSSCNVLSYIPFWLKRKYRLFPDDPDRIQYLWGWDYPHGDENE